MALLKEEIPRSLHGSGHSHSSSSSQVPVSASQRFLHMILEEGEVPDPVYKKKAAPALIPALAGLATIAVESLNSFLLKKQNKAMASGLSALKHDQTLAWNSLRQLETDFLLYGKYNVEKLQDIVKTINSLRNRTLSIRKASHWPGYAHFTGCTYGTRCHWKDDIHT